MTETINTEGNTDYRKELRQEREVEIKKDYFLNRTKDTDRSHGVDIGGDEYHEEPIAEVQSNERIVGITEGLGPNESLLDDLNSERGEEDGRRPSTLLNGTY